MFSCLCPLPPHWWVDDDDMFAAAVALLDIVVFKFYKLDCACVKI